MWCDFVVFLNSQLQSFPFRAVTELGDIRLRTEKAGHKSLDSRLQGGRSFLLLAQSPQGYELEKTH